MFPRLSGTVPKLRFARRCLSGGASSHPKSLNGTRNYRRLLLAVTSGAALVTLSTVYTRRPALNDAPKASTTTPTKTLDEITPVSKDGHLQSLIWGSNKSSTIDPTKPDVDTFQTPTPAPWLNGVALRDLALHGGFGVCVDARGDVYQWGNSIRDVKETAPWKPRLVLHNKDITSIQVSSSRIFALSSSGAVYAVSPNGEVSENGTPASSWSISAWFKSAPLSRNVVELNTAEKLSRGEKFSSISAGNNHLLALTSSGRAFVHPINKESNSNGQLGLRTFDIPALDTSKGSRVTLEVIPRSVADPFEKATPFAREGQDPLKDIDDSHLGFSDRLFEIPSLKGIKIAQVAAGGRSSFVRTAEEGRVLGWGANEYGQLGLGVGTPALAITVPTEVVLSRLAPNPSRTRCTHIAAGGDLTYFIVERQDGTSIPSTEVLACGMGQRGGLGNGLYTTSQITPLKVKAVSGLLEFSEKSQNMQAITAHGISVSSTGHVVLTLDTLERAGPGHAGGRDLFVWGSNQDYQLGNGKRTSLAKPANLEVAGSSGRLMLTKRKGDVRDMQGKLWKRAVDVEQVALAGQSSTIIYWKLC